MFSSAIASLPCGPSSMLSTLPMSTPEIRTSDCSASCEASVKGTLTW
jgi:hypothetical protein